MQERGIALSENRRKRIKGEARRDEEMQERGATVLRAPPGMSRALQNKSRWDNRHKCVVWTVEWIFENGDKIYGNCQESRTVTEALANAVGSRKMQRLQARSAKATSSTRDADPCKADTEGQAKHSLDLAADAESASNSALHFYLHRPNLPSNVKCLIPLQPHATVKDVTRDRVLVEFPTIFVLSISKERLQKPFVTEEDYLKQQTEEPPTSESQVTKPPVTFDDRHQDLGAHEVPLGVDEQQIMEVVHKDLGT